MKALVLCLIYLSIGGHTAKAQGEHAGGGDYKSEGRIKSIRDNILQWIEVGNDQNLKFPSGLTRSIYESGDKVRNITGMKAVLSSDLNTVVVNVIRTSEEDSNDFEKNTWVGEKPKTCKWFISQKDRLKHILCNYEKFWDQSESDQYRLIHHEYAGLAGVESASGADSDYTLSDQISASLKLEQVLRLPIKSAISSEESNLEIFALGSDLFARAKLPGMNDLTRDRAWLFEKVTKLDDGTFDGPRYFALCFSSYKDSRANKNIAFIYEEVSRTELQGAGCEDLNKLESPADYFTFIPTDKDFAFNTVRGARCHIKVLDQRVVLSCTGESGDSISMAPSIP